MKGLDLSALKSLIAEIQLMLNYASSEKPAVSNFAAAKKSDAGPEMSMWLDDTDLMNLFHICSRTVRRRRKDGTFKSTPIGGRHYYRRQDILDLGNRFMK